LEEPVTFGHYHNGASFPAIAAGAYNPYIDISRPAISGGDAANILLFEGRAHCDEWADLLVEIAAIDNQQPTRKLVLRVLPGSREIRNATVPERVRATGVAICPGYRGQSAPPVARSRFTPGAVRVTESARRAGPVGDG
jgi:hypothetical protein